MATPFANRPIGIFLLPPHPAGLHLAKILGLKDKHLLISLPQKEGKGLWLKTGTHLLFSSPDAQEQTVLSIAGTVVGRSTKPIPLLVVSLEKDLPLGLLGKRSTLVLAVASGKGGTGKTTLATGLALSLAKEGHRTALIDADLGGGNVALYLGLKGNGNLGKALRGEEPLIRCLVPGPWGVAVTPGLEAAPESATPSAWQLSKLCQGLAELEQEYACLVLDLSAGFSPTVSSLILQSGHLVLVTGEDPASLLDAYGLLKLATQRDSAPKVHLLINRVEAPSVALDRAKSLQETAARFLRLQVHFLGLVPADPMVTEAVRKGINPVLYRPEHPYSRRIAAYAHTLFGQTENKAAHRGTG